MRIVGTVEGQKQQVRTTTVNSIHPVPAAPAARSGNRQTHTESVAQRSGCVNPSLTCRRFRRILEG